MIHICYALFDKDGRYSKFTGTSILSVFENVTTPPPCVTVHLLHDNTLTQDNRNKFFQLAKTYRQTIKFYNLEELCPDKIAEFNSFFDSVNPTGTRTLGNLYRFCIPYVIREKIPQIIYFDSDTIININIKKIRDINIGTFSMAAVPEVESYVNTGIHALVKRNIVVKEDYFNSGILIINLDNWRNEEKFIAEGIKFVINNPDCDCIDQDMLNYCFSKNYLKLPKKFNTLVEYARMNNDFDTNDRICHYINSSPGQGFGLGTNDAYNKLFLKYFIKTPWFNEESVGGLYQEIIELYNKEIIKLHNKCQNFSMQISALISGKQRAFFVSPQNVDAVKKIFYVNPDEEIICEGDLESIQNLVVALRTAGGKKYSSCLSSNIPQFTNF